VRFGEAAEGPPGTMAICSCRSNCRVQLAHTEGLLQLHSMKLSPS
jgi:hypothetical protein